MEWIIGCLRKIDARGGDALGRDARAIDASATRLLGQLGRIGKRRDATRGRWINRFAI
jgi:hypothetical protein